MPTDAPLRDDRSRLSGLTATGDTMGGAAANRPKFGPRLLGRLARFAAAANLSRAALPETAIEPRTARTIRNLCEFDYDYYVALSGHRRHRPARLRDA